MPPPPTDAPHQAAGILRLVLFRFPSARFPSASCVTLIRRSRGCPYKSQKKSMLILSSLADRDICLCVLLVVGLGIKLHKKQLLT
ncbi:hypothetical protein E4T56_gene6015 [Termitomyces sp. T112]|nr:hypothetical protein E4T56_gene6015 [Termitomyces sp. T112]